MAARHTKNLSDATLKLVQQLFEEKKFNVLIIEPYPFSFGESPKWFLEEAHKGKTQDFIKGGESALAAILAAEKKIPFFAGEPDDQDILRGLKNKGFTELDLIGFYSVRQIPQWVGEREYRRGLLERKIPKFASHYCRTLKISACPTLPEIIQWYKSNNGKELTADVLNEVVAPYSDGKLHTQKISTEIGFIRDRFTLKTIEKMLLKYKKVAVVYGAGHFLALRKSFDASFGEPVFTEIQER